MTSIIELGISTKPPIKKLRNKHINQYYQIMHDLVICLHVLLLKHQILFIMLILILEIL